MGNVQQCFTNPKYKKAVMSTDFPTDTSNGNSEMQNIMNRKNAHNRVVTTSSHLQTNHQETTTSSRVAKSSTQVHVTGDRGLTVKNKLGEFKDNIAQMKNVSLSSNYFLRKSLDNLVDGDGDSEMHTPQPLVTFPDDTPTPSEVGTPTNILDTLKFEQKTSNNYSRTKVISDMYSAEKKSRNFAESKSVQSGDVSYEENSHAAEHHARVEIDGISAEKSLVNAKERTLAIINKISETNGKSVLNMAKCVPADDMTHLVKVCDLLAGNDLNSSVRQEERSLLTADKLHQESKNMAHSSMKVTSDTFSTEKTATEAQQKQQMVTSSGVYQNVFNNSSSSNITYTSSSGSHKTSTSQLHTNAQLFQLNGREEELLNIKFDDLKQLTMGSNPEDVATAIKKYTACLGTCVRYLKEKSGGKSLDILNKMNEIMQTAWVVPTHGHELGFSLCNALRDCGGLDLLMENCNASETNLRFASARVLEQCLTTENRAHVVKHGLTNVVDVACFCTNITNSTEHSRVGTGILEHLFKHSEETCSDVIRLGGLDAVLFECRRSDLDTLRHVAGALANLSLYGGAENQEAMIKRNVPMWLFPLAFHNDDNIKYYACLAITVLVANPEIEAEVLSSGTLGLVEPFVTTHNPADFAKSNSAHAHGQSKTWLQHLVPVLSSKREEARNLAAFHFCMEAGIKKQQGNTNIFGEIGAIESLKKVASCPNAVASKYAAGALRLIGEVVPHKLSQQVPLWSAEDVEEWVKQIGFVEYAASFIESRVDGDLLLQLTEGNLKDDIGLTNGIKRIRFFRELQKLKRMADYSSRDVANINNFLQSMGPEFSIYTYSMLNAGVETKDSLRRLSEDQLLQECGIVNSIHRMRIIEGIGTLENGLTSLNDDSMDKSLDVFVSYRRSNGSQLASLLKVHLQLRGFSVFIDVERLEAGKFDNNLLQSIQKAKHFLLVLTVGSLDRCLGDVDKKDWVHREIVAALSANCNIIPIIDNFQWPEADVLPEDMRQVCHFNGVRWIHDYQDACVDKLERFMRGEFSTRNDVGLMNRAGLTKCDMAPSTPSTAGINRAPPNYQRMHSNDSGSGKSSDKDVNGNSGHRD